MPIMEDTSDELEKLMYLAQSLPISAIVKSTFQKVNSWFVERGMMTDSMLRPGHQYPEDITNLLQKNQQASAFCHVERYNRKNSEFDVQEITTAQLYGRPMSYIVKLNEWWCDCGGFQAFWLPCPHVIVVCSMCHLQLLTYVDPVYTLHNIFKAYELQFHAVRNEDYWSAYMVPNFIPDPHMRRTKSEIPTKSRIHNEMDEVGQNIQKKCSYCRNEGHNCANCPYK